MQKTCNCKKCNGECYLKKESEAEAKVIAQKIANLNPELEINVQRFGAEVAIFVGTKTGKIDEVKIPRNFYTVKVPDEYYFIITNFGIENEAIILKSNIFAYCASA